MFIDKLNDLSRITVSNIDQLNCEDLVMMSNTIKNGLDLELSKLNVGNNTTVSLLKSPLNEQHFDWAMKEQKLLRKNTEWLNYWISKLKLCQDTIDILLSYLKRYCTNLLYWKNLKLNGSSDANIDLAIQNFTNLLSKTGQSLGIVIYDYLDLLKTVNQNSGKNFKKPYITDPEDAVSERISCLNDEIEKFLLSNPNKNILGMSAIRTFFESYILMITRDKIRSHIRKKKNDNNIDIKFVDNFYHKTEIFQIITTLFPELKNSKSEHVLDSIYGRSSKSIHKGIPTPNYLIWTCWDFVSKELKNKFDNLNEHSSTELVHLISILENSKKLVEI